MLGSARQAHNISNKRYIELLWGDTLSEEEKADELKAIEESDSQDVFNLGPMNDADAEE